MAQTRACVVSWSCRRCQSSVLLPHLLPPPPSSFHASSTPSTNSSLLTRIHDPLPLPLPLSLSTIPILPVPNVSDILPLLLTYTSTLHTSTLHTLTLLNPTPLNHTPPTPPPRQIALTLLPQMTTSPSGLTQHETNVLSDICRSVEEVCALASSVEGRRELCGWLGEEVGREVGAFWGYRDEESDGVAGGVDDELAEVVDDELGVGVGGVVDGEAMDLDGVLVEDFGSGLGRSEWRSGTEKLLAAATKGPRWDQLGNDAGGGDSEMRGGGGEAEGWDDLDGLLPML